MDTPSVMQGALALSILAFVGIFIATRSASHDGSKLHHEIDHLVSELQTDIMSVEEIADTDLHDLEKEILLLVKSPSREGYSFPQNYWPMYYYSYPYQSQVAWPPGLYSRLYNWQPGFTTSGWSYQLRPGLQYVRMPRARWYRNNGHYYYINNVF